MQHVLHHQLVQVWVIIRVRELRADDFIVPLWGQLGGQPEQRVDMRKACMDVIDIEFIVMYNVLEQLITA